MQRDNAAAYAPPSALEDPWLSLIAGKSQALSTPRKDYTPVPLAQASDSGKQQPVEAPRFDSAQSLFQQSVEHPQIEGT